MIVLEVLSIRAQSIVVAGSCEAANGQSATLVYQRHDLPDNGVVVALCRESCLGRSGKVWQAFGNFHDAFFYLRGRQGSTGRKLLPMPCRV